MEFGELILVEMAERALGAPSCVQSRNNMSQIHKNIKIQKNIKNDAIDARAGWCNLDNDDNVINNLDNNRDKTVDNIDTVDKVDNVDDIDNVDNDGNISRHRWDNLR